MKLNCIYLLLIGWIAFLFTNCSEYLGRKPERIDRNVLDALVRIATNAAASSSCGRFSPEPIRGGVGQITGSTNGIRQGFNLFGCSDSASLTSLGFPNENLQFTGNGVKGNALNSRFASTADYVTGGARHQSFEATFTLDRSDGFLQIFTNASANGASSDGPSVKITPSSIRPIFATGIEQNFDGVPPSTPVGTVRTYCFDSHNESGNWHILGWSRPCQVLTQQDRANGSQEFSKLINTNQPGSRVGFVLNGATIRSIIVGEMIAPH